jgi:hypothetical protein
MEFWAKGVPEATIRRLLGAVDRYVKHPARDYVVKAV